MVALTPVNVVVGGVEVGLLTAAVAGLYNDVKNVSSATPNSYTQDIPVFFPNDLLAVKNTNYCIVFQFYKYVRPSILYAPTLTSLGSIALPLPSDMIDQTKLQYSEEGSNLAVGAALESAQQLASVSQISMDKINQALQTLIIDTAQNVGIQAVSSLANQITTNGLAKGLQLLGLAQNPFLTVLFDQPTFKRHVFNWTFIPETAKDATTLRYIKNKFIYHSLADVAGQSGAILTYPDMVVPTIYPSGYVYDFKKCVIEAAIGNYAPGDTPSFTNPINAPSSFRLTLSLLEIEYWLKKDMLSGDYPNYLPNPPSYQPAYSP